jgi:outer membrane protein assembly factor BamB
LALDWNFPTGYEIYSSPAVGVDGTIYIGTYDAYPPDIPKLYAINPDGTEKWRFLTTHYGKVDSSPAIGPDGTIYIATHEGPCTRVNPPCQRTGNACPDVFAINSDGTEKWHLCLWPDPTLPSPGDCLNPACGWDLVEYSDLAVTVEDGMSVIYVGSWYGYLYRIEDHGTHGEIAWHRLVSPIEGAPLLFAPAVGSDKTIYIGTMQLPLVGGGDLWAINSDGSDKWTTPVHLTTAPGEAVAAPAVEIVDLVQNIYVGTSDNQMCKVVDMGTRGERSWTFRAGGDIVCCPGVKDLNDDDMVDIVFGSLDDNVYAITDRGNNWGNDVTDGIPLWTFATHGDVSSSPVIDKFGTVYIGSHDGNVYAISKDGTNTFSYATDGPVWSSVAISKCSWPSGISWRLYVGSNDGNLYSLRGIDLRVVPYPL